MSKVRSTANFPTHTQIADFVASILPIHHGDVPFCYHTPRHSSYDKNTSPVSHLVLSITPTLGVYTKLQSLAQNNRNKPLCFLHRPFGLDRRSVPRGALVLASHKRFDEQLTVGHNLPLATSLGLDLKDHIVVCGYKEDPDRLMGLVALLQKSKTLDQVGNDIASQFGPCEIHASEEGSRSTYRAIAIMNAFNAETVGRVINAVKDKGWIAPTEDMRSVVYLTGEARESGLKAAQYVNMTTVCAGHRASEEWGIRWLSQKLRDAYPTLNVSEMFEDEEPPTKKVQDSQTASQWAEHVEVC